MSVPLSDQLQIWGFESGFILFSDGSIGFGLELSPVDVGCWDDSRIDGLASRIALFLNGLPTGVDFQLVQEIGKGNLELIGRYEKLRLDTVTETIKALHKTRIDSLKEDEGNGYIPRHTLKAFIRRSPVAPLLGKPAWFSRPKLFEDIADQALSREIAATAQLREEVTRGFQSLEITSSIIGEREIADLIYWQWNPNRGVGLAGYDADEIRSSLIFTDVSLSLSGFSIGDMHHRVVSLKLLPDQTYASMARVLRDLPFDTRLFLTIHVPDQQKELESLQTQRRIAFSMARGKQTGVSDIESEAKFQDLEGLISEMVAQGEKVFHFSLNVLLRSKNEDELRDLASQTILKIRELSAAEAFEESLAAFEIFSELSIPNARAKERARRIKTSNLADLLPVFGPWAGHETPRILLKSGHGSLVSFDPFSKDLSNYNQIVTGGSGSGKSFLTNILLLQMLKEDPKVFIVDIGGSYKKLCDNLSGQYIQFNLTSNLAINPFDLPEGETEPESQKIKFLVGLVEMMTKEEGEVRIGRLERAEIEDAIQTVYQGIAIPSLSALKQLLIDHKDPVIQRFGKILSPWCGNTPFGRLVDRPTTMALERSLVSFDLKGLETYPDLQAVCLYIITDYVWREVQRDRSHMKFLVFDECWKLLENDAGSSFIGEVFRTFRKYYASAIAISQNIDDFAKSKVAGALLPNTSIKWVLMQKGADQARLKEVLQLNDGEMALIASLHQERGVYSQAFLMAEDKHSLVAIQPTPLEYWIATTDPRDLSIFDSELKRTPDRSQLELLLELSERFPKGVVASKGAA